MLEASHKSYCTEETSKATQKEGNLEAVVAIHTSKLKQPPPGETYVTSGGLVPGVPHLIL